MSLVEFEKHKVVKSFMETFDVYYTNLGGYHYSKDDSPCYYLNGMLTMFEEQQKKIDEVSEKHSEEKRILHNVIEMNQAKIDELEFKLSSTVNNFDNSCKTIAIHQKFLDDADVANKFLTDKIDELKKLRSLDEMAINQLAQANQVWQIKCDELQARVDEVLIEMKNQLGDEDFYDMERPDYDAMLYALRNIKDILK